jgi:tRNA (cytidine32/uridine32-2'-O)-methyltransferase
MTSYSTPFNNIRIVLVETSHPGNIGSTARAMKVMGFTDLVLVAPKQFPDSHATALASGADDILASARVVDTLEEALADVRLAVAASARSRSYPWPMLTPTQAAETLMNESQAATVALVFGHERAGLSNEQLQMCQFHTAIASNPDYPALNLAQAVQVFTYEMRRVVESGFTPACPKETVYATVADIEHLFSHLQTVLNDMRFLSENNPSLAMMRLKRLLQRTRLEEVEVKLLRGLLKHIQQNVTTDV